jgi:endothelin-converting enzyme/putative endopeptidase
MNRRLIALASALLATVALHAQERPERIEPLTSLDLTALDRSVDPCADFYQFACGGWRKTHPIPGDKARWGRFDELAEYNRYLLKDILDEVSAAGPKGTPIERQVGDAYAACMDQATIDSRGLAPVQPYLAAVDAAATKADLARALGSLRRDGVTGLFTFAVGPDFRDSNSTLMNVDQGGLTLPDRDFYLKNDPKNTETREKYVAYIESVLRLAGEPAAEASSHAAAVLALETRLARAQLDRTARRDPRNRDHRMTRDDLEALAPSFDFGAYFASAQAPDFRDVNVGWPDFFKTLGATWQATSIEDAKSYARWRVLNAAAPVLAEPFEKASFDFFSGYLRGIKEQPPRWKTCVEAVDGSLGEALGQLYVARAFGAEGKARMQRLVEALATALEQDIDALDWMTPATKAKAIEKLHKLGKSKIGFPDKWRDYSSVRITRDDYAGNSFRADAFEVKRNYDKLGKPVDKNDWNMTPPTVNAYYSGQLAEIVFPAGILQPPFFNREADDPVNFGGIGSVIGHELSVVFVLSVVFFEV